MYSEVDMKIDREMCVYTLPVYIHICLHSAEKTRRRDTPVAINFPLLKEPASSRKWLIPRLRQGTQKVRLEHLKPSESEKGLKTKTEAQWGPPKATRALPTARAGITGATKSDNMGITQRKNTHDSVLLYRRIPILRVEAMREIEKPLFQERHRKCFQQDPRIHNEGAKCEEKQDTGIVSKCLPRSFYYLQGEQQ